MRSPLFLCVNNVKNEGKTILTVVILDFYF